MICEPNLSLPQHVDINSLRDKPAGEKLAEEKNVFSNLNFVSHVSSQYNVLPVFVHQHFDVNVLSLKHNEYLLLRWNEFLEKKPEHFVRIQLYVDFKSSKIVPKARRMQLNGQFYGVDNKLAPIPMSDIRPANIKKLTWCKQAAGKQSTVDENTAA